MPVSRANRRVRPTCPQRAGELAGDGSHRVGVIGEIGRQNQGFFSGFRSAHAPQGRFERVQYVS